MDRPLDTNGRPLATKFVNLHCDFRFLYGVRCQHQATRGARLIVPPVRMETPEFVPLRRFTDLNACERHIGNIAVAPADILTPRLKRDFEDAARKIRPLGFKPDFERAYLEWVLTTTPEYRQFLQRLDDNLARLRAAGTA